MISNHDQEASVSVEPCEDDCHERISFAEFDASVQGWINHVRYADSWDLHRHVLGKGLVHTRPDKEQEP